MLAAEDSLFAKTYIKPNKSISECCRYIFQEAKKQAVNGCCALEDDAVYQMAIHYYDEDSIVVDKAPVRSKVVVKAPTPKPEPKKPKYVQLSLFDFDNES